MRISPGERVTDVAGLDVVHRDQAGDQREAARARPVPLPPIDAGAIGRARARAGRIDRCAHLAGPARRRARGPEVPLGVCVLVDQAEVSIGTRGGQRAGGDRHHRYGRDGARVKEAIRDRRRRDRHQRRRCGDEVKGDAECLDIDFE